MKEVIITQGAYGHRAEGSPFVKLVAKGETCIVTDGEAERLEKLGVAKILCTNIVEAEYSDVAAEASASDEEDIETVDITTLSFNQLKEMAENMGISNIGKLNSKQKLIDAISSFEDEAPELAAEGLVE